MASDESHLNAFINCEGQSHKTVPVLGRGIKLNCTQQRPHTVSVGGLQVDVFTVVAVTVGKTDGLVQHNFRRAAPGSFVLPLEKATKQLATPQLIVEEFICTNGGRVGQR